MYANYVKLTKFLDCYCSLVKLLPNLKFKNSVVLRMLPVSVLKKQHKCDLLFLNEKLALRNLIRLGESLFSYAVVSQQWWTLQQ